MKIYKSEFKDVDIRKAKSKILREATFSVTNVDSAIDTISDCIQWIMVKKSLNPSISAELISKAIVQDLILYLVLQMLLKKQYNKEQN